LLAAGQTFARYVIEAPIGEGGMGEVYRAYDEKLRRKVALKVLHPDLQVPDAAARLVREARAAAALTHPNTIAIFDLGEIDGTVFLVMELVSGASLRAYVGDRSIPVRRKLRWLVDVARGLAAAHEAGLVHRDVKPANVMVSDQGVVKVLDFGLAKTLEASSFHSDAGLVAGTPRYMAAELFTGMPADARSDQYAFGVTAYELLSGEYCGSAMGPVPKALDELVPEVGPRVARVIARTLSRSPGDRFASMTELADALDELASASRASAVEAAPSTRREGAAPTAAPARHLALAMAATELQSSGTAARGAPPPRSGKLWVVPVVALLAVGGWFGAMRFLGEDRPVLAGDAAPAFSASAANDDGAIDAHATFAELLDAALALPLEDASAEAASDADDDADAADAGSEAASAGPRHVVPLDDFPDPWLKRPAAPR